MSCFPLKELREQKLYLPQEGLLALIAQKSDCFIFIKNNLSVYQYANPQFLDLMGLKELKNIYRKTDFDLCRDTKKVDTYLQHDAMVLDTGEILPLLDDVLPKKNEMLSKQMVGSLYPVFSEKKSGPIAVLGTVKPYYLPFKLNLETALGMSKEEMDNLFIRRSYQVTVHNHTVRLSKREIQCIIELLKGKHAGEIADALQLKQSTIEFYLGNIKNKLGATGKSSLITTVFNQKILQQLIL